MPLSMTRTDHRVAALLGFDRDAAVARRVLRGIVQQVGEHLREPHDVGIENDFPRGDVDRELVLLRVDQRAAGLDRLTNHLVERSDFLVEVDPIVADAAHVEQVVDEAHHLPELQIHHVARALEQTGVVLRELEQLQAVAQRRQRIAQLMSQRREELVLAPIHRAQLVAAFLQNCR